MFPPLPSPFSEWQSNVHRDSYASYLGHFNILRYMAAARGDSVGRMQHELFGRLLQPCGPPPERGPEEEEE